MVTPAVNRVDWPQTHRIIRSIYPPIDLFEDIADPADWELIASAESKTNPRVRDQLGSIHLVPPGRRVGGPGASWVMAPFCHISSDRQTRFSDGTYGVYYAGNRFDVALHETIYHFENFMRRTKEEPDEEDFRELVGSINSQLHDIRDDDSFEHALDPDSYGTSQGLAAQLRNQENSNGIVCPSVRFPEGEAIAAFWPDVVTVPNQGRHVCYRWDGTRVDAFLIYGEDDWHQI